MCVRMFKTTDKKKHLKATEENSTWEAEVKRLVRFIRNKSVKTVEQQIHGTEVKAKTVNLELCTHKTLCVCVHMREYCASMCVSGSAYASAHMCRAQGQLCASPLFLLLEEGSLLFTAEMSGYLALSFWEFPQLLMPPCHHRRAEVSDMCSRVWLWMCSQDLNLARSVYATSVLSTAPSPRPERSLLFFSSEN